SARAPYTRESDVDAAASNGTLRRLGGCCQHHPMTPSKYRVVMTSRCPMPRRKYAWEKLSDEELLKRRLSRLRGALEGTWLEDCVRTLYEELEGRGIRLRPHAWISSEWFSPANVPGIAIPFYLTHPRLMKIEKKMMLDVEGGTWFECMAILRHEAGHAVQ